MKLARPLVVLLSLAALGCTSQPVAPSRLPTTFAAPAEVAPSSAIALTATTSSAGGRTGATGVVYVTSQGLYYDTFVTADPLPFEGRFQKIENGTTMYGPGQPGYLGGRWWEDSNNNGVQDPTDHYFLCPLLPPGRPTP